MENITELFDDLYVPESGFIIYKNRQDESDCYVESFDIGDDGNPINMHPLSESETTALAKALDSSKTLEKSFLRPKGLITENVLYIDANRQGCAVWYTPAREEDLFFVADLGIPNGKAFVPALLWKAGRQQLEVFALKDDGKPDLNTPLYHAPFFNLYKSGKVCMGTVDVRISEAVSLEDFIAAWQRYFFQSYFSHLIDAHNPVKSNIAQLWQNLIATGKPFPKTTLLKSKATLRSLIQ